MGGYRVENLAIKGQAKMRYKKNTEPFVDLYNDVWMKKDGAIFVSWQQEKLCY